MDILVNLKAYRCDWQGIVAAVRRVADESGATIGVAPQAARLSVVADRGVDTWAQHVSPVEHGSHTGSTHVAAVAEAGAAGTLLNHSERRLSLADIDAGIRRAHDRGLETIVCANNPGQIAAVAALGPDAVAVEPPALIGTGTPVSRADPDVVRDAVEAAASVDPTIPVLCGAGISSGADVEAALELGAAGVLLASGVAKADDPGTVLEDLAAPFTA